MGVVTMQNTESQVPEGYKKTDVGVIPVDWEVKSLGEIGKCIRGVSYKGDSDLFEYLTSEATILLRSNNVFEHRINFDDVQFVRKTLVKEEQFFQEDDVLICMANGSKRLVGKSGLYQSKQTNCTFGAFMSIFRTNAELFNPKFISSLLLSHQYRSYIDVLLSGSSINNLRPSDIESLHFAIPPTLEEQQTIAQVLTNMDDYIHSLQQLVEKKKNIKQGTMQQLLTGRTRLPGFGGTDVGTKKTDVGVIPVDWEVKTFGEVFTVNQGLQIQISERLTMPTVKSKVYITIQYLNGDKVLEYIEDYSQAVCCTEEDILMTRTGNTGVVVTNVNGVFHNNFFKIKYSIQQFVKDYIVYFLNLKSIQKQILAKAGTSTIPDLNHNDFYSLGIWIPTLEEQQAIAQVLTNMDDEITALQEKIEKAKQVKQGAMQELLTGKRRLV